MTAREMAERLMIPNSAERKEAERMMGETFENMTQEQRRCAAAVLSAFWKGEQNK